MSAKMLLPDNPFKNKYTTIDRVGETLKKTLQTRRRRRLSFFDSWDNVKGAEDKEINFFGWRDVEGASEVFGLEKEEECQNHFILLDSWEDVEGNADEGH